MSDGLPASDPPSLVVLLLPWIFVPLTALDWWCAWGRLPERVVMKLGANGQPIHWATRDEAMRFDLVFLAGVLAFTTLLAFLVGLARPDGARRVWIGVALCDTFIFLVLNGVLWTVQVP